MCVGRIVLPPLYIILYGIHLNLQNAIVNEKETWNFITQRDDDDDEKDEKQKYKNLNFQARIFHN